MTALQHLMLNECCVRILLTTKLCWEKSQTSHDNELAHRTSNFFLYTKFETLHKSSCPMATDILEKVTGINFSHTWELFMDRSKGENEVLCLLKEKVWSYFVNCFLCELQSFLLHAIIAFINHLCSLDY